MSARPHRGRSRRRLRSHRRRRRRRRPLGGSCRSTCGRRPSHSGPADALLASSAADHRARTGDVGACPRPLGRRCRRAGLARDADRSARLVAGDDRARRRRCRRWLHRVATRLPTTGWPPARDAGDDRNRRGRRPRVDRTRRPGRRRSVDGPARADARTARALLRPARLRGGRSSNVARPPGDHGRRRRLRRRTAHRRRARVVDRWMGHRVDRLTAPHHTDDRHHARRSDVLGAPPRTTDRMGCRRRAGHARAAQRGPDPRRTGAARPARPVERRPDRGLAGHPRRRRRNPCCAQHEPQRRHRLARHDRRLPRLHRHPRHEPARRTRRPGRDARASARTGVLARADLHRVRRSGVDRRPRDRHAAGRSDDRRRPDARRCRRTHGPLRGVRPDVHDRIRSPEPRARRLASHPGRLRRVGVDPPGRRARGPT